MTGAEPPPRPSTGAAPAAADRPHASGMEDREPGRGHAAAPETLPWALLALHHGALVLCSLAFTLHWYRTVVLWQHYPQAALACWGCLGLALILAGGPLWWPLYLAAGAILLTPTPLLLLLNLVIVVKGHGPAERASAALALAAVMAAIILLWYGPSIRRRCRGAIGTGPAD